MQRLMMGVDRLVRRRRAWVLVAWALMLAVSIPLAVFAVFAFTGVPSIQGLGVGNAVAIAIDATLVRLVLVPAAMELLGDWNGGCPSRSPACCPALRLGRSP